MERCPLFGESSFFGVYNYAPEYSEELVDFRISGK